MSGGKAECVKALAAPMPKLMFRPGTEDAAVGKDKKEKLPVRQDPSVRLLPKMRDRAILLPLLLSQSKTNALDNAALSNSTQALSDQSSAAEVENLPKLVDLKTSDVEDISPYSYLSLFGPWEDVERLVGTECKCL